MIFGKDKVARQLWPMIFVEIVILVLVTYVPAITLALPHLIE
jgi:TRAP-type C4-dicarboxylate transport system permease large subunit